MSARESRFVPVDGSTTGERSDDRWHVCPIPIGADPDRDHAREVDPVDLLDEAPDEVTARLLTVGDDVDAGIFLIAKREHDGVLLALVKRAPIEKPWRPQRFGLGEPRGFGKTAGDRRLEHVRTHGIMSAMTRWMLLLATCLLSLAACASDSEKQWYKPGVSYTMADFERDQA